MTPVGYIREDLVQPLLFDATGAVVLLALSTALGAYMRGVHASAAEAYDRTATEDSWHKILWPRGQEYTEERLRNLQRVMTHLQIISGVMFVFALIAALRLAASALNNDTCTFLSAHGFVWLHISDICAVAQSRTNLAVADFLLTSCLVLAYIGSFVAHLVGSRAEKKARKNAYKAYNRNRELANQANLKDDGNQLLLEIFSIELSPST